MRTQAKAIAIRFLRPIQRKVIRPDMAALMVAFEKGEQYSGVPTYYVVNRFGGPREVFDLLTGTGSVIKAIPSNATEII